LKLKNSNLFIFSICAILGAVFFVYFIGVAVLDFTNTGWLMDTKEIAQHYLGWEFFRNSAWHFPLGLTDGIVYPYLESVVYSDCVPLFALIFKAASPVLPQNFQYFGLYALLCFMAQGGVAGLIIKRFSKNIWITMLCACFYISSTIMMWRLFIHFSLCAHFIILICIYLCLTRKTSFIQWSAVMAAAALIHIYFIPMVAVFIVFNVIDEFCENRKIIQPALKLSVPAAVTLAVMYAIGCFYSNAPKIEGGLTYYNANLNTLINPREISSVLPKLPYVSIGQYEGIAYMGLGMLFCAAVCIALFLIKRKFSFNRVFILTAGLIAVFLLLALSNEITLGDKTIFTYPIPAKVEHYWSMFRATGRMIWPVFYVIMTVVFVYLIKNMNKKIIIFVLIIALSVQFFDLYNFYSHHVSSQISEYKTPLSLQKWDEISNNRSHIVFLGSAEDTCQIAKFALDNGMTVNDMYLARKNRALIEENKQRELELIKTGQAREDTVYIFTQPPEKYYDGLDIFVLDGYIIGVTS